MSIPARVPVLGAVALSAGQAAAILRTGIPRSCHGKVDNVSKDCRLGIKGGTLYDAVIMQRIASRVVEMAYLAINALTAMQPMPSACRRGLIQGRKLVA
jgi:hypothetical protein